MIFEITFGLLIILDLKSNGLEPLQSESQI